MTRIKNLVFFLSLSIKTKVIGGKDIMCYVDGCENTKVHAKGLCKRHYEINRRWGSPYIRTRWDRNEIIVVKGDYAEIILYNNKSNEIARTLIDADDIERIKDYKWHIANSLNYVEAIINRKKTALHRYIIGAQKSEIVDHKNRNVLDNRKDNLRICTLQQNAYNKRLPKNNTSGYLGVTWHKRHQKWMASLCFNKKLVFIGYFEDYNEAVNERIKAEKEYFGEFASSNNL